MKIPQTLFDINVIGFDSHYAQSSNSFISITDIFFFSSLLIMFEWLGIHCVQCYDLTIAFEPKCRFCHVD